MRYNLARSFSIGSVNPWVYGEVSFKLIDVEASIYGKKIIADKSEKYAVENGQINYTDISNNHAFECFTGAHTTSHARVDLLFLSNYTHRSSQ